MVVEAELVYPQLILVDIAEGMQQQQLGLVSVIVDLQVRELQIVVG